MWHGNALKVHDSLAWQPIISNNPHSPSSGTQIPDLHCWPSAKLISKLSDNNPILISKNDTATSRVQLIVPKYAVINERFVLNVEPLVAVRTRPQTISSLVRQWEMDLGRLDGEEFLMIPERIYEALFNGGGSSFEVNVHFLYEDLDVNVCQRVCLYPHLSDRFQRSLVLPESFYKSCLEGKLVMNNIDYDQVISLPLMGGLFAPFRLVIVPSDLKYGLVVPELTQIMIMHE